MRLYRLLALPRVVFFPDLLASDVTSCSYRTLPAEEAVATKTCFDPLDDDDLISIDVTVESLPLTFFLFQGGSAITAHGFTFLAANHR